MILQLFGADGMLEFAITYIVKVADLKPDVRWHLISGLVSETVCTMRDEETRLVTRSATTSSTAME